MRRARTRRNKPKSIDKIPAASNGGRQSRRPAAVLRQAFPTAGNHSGKAAAAPYFFLPPRAGAPPAPPMHAPEYRRPLHCIYLAGKYRRLPHSAPGYCPKISALIYNTSTAAPVSCSTCLVLCPSRQAPAAKAMPSQSRPALPAMPKTPAPAFSAPRIPPSARARLSPHQHRQGNLGVFGPACRRTNQPSRARRPL